MKMGKRALGLALAVLLVVGLTVLPAKAATSIQIGQYVQMGTYYGEPILWRCVDIGENGPLMLSDKILCIKAFDAGGDNTSGSHGRGPNRQSYGSNYWGDSNLRSWLNSTASAGNVTWLCGNPPIASELWGGYNAYDQEAGFLSNFTQSELNAIKEVRQKSLLSWSEIDAGMATTGLERYTYSDSIDSVVRNYDTAYAEYVTDKMFLLDVKQINAVYNNGSTLGADYYIGEPTAACVANSEYKSSSLAAGNKWYSLLCSPTSGFNYLVVYVYPDGEVNDHNARDGDVGVRPAFYLDLSAASIQSGEGTEEDPYMIAGESGVTQATLVETHYPGTVQTVPSSWAEAEVSAARENGIVPEGLDGNYTGNITRAEFCRVAMALVRSLGRENDVVTKTTVILNGQRFSDTDDADVLAMNDAGVVNGYGDGRFGPDDPITREQAAVMLARLARKLEPEGGYGGLENRYTDALSVSEWARQDVAYISKCKTSDGKAVMGGSGGYFSPKNYYTREQSFLSFQRLYGCVTAPGRTQAQDDFTAPANDLDSGRWAMAQRAAAIVDALCEKARQRDSDVLSTTQAETDKLKKTIHAARLCTHKGDHAVPDEVYQAFAMAVYNAVDSSNLDKLETDPVELTNQLYDQVKGGLARSQMAVPVTKGRTTTTYQVDYEIFSQSWLGFSARVSYATVTWTADGENHAVKLTSTDEEGMKKALSSFGAVLAQLNTDVWKDFMASFFSDGFGLADVKVSKQSAKAVLDGAEKVINALGDREAAQALMDEVYDDLTDETKDWWDEYIDHPFINQLAEYIKDNVPDSDLVFDAVDAYKKVKKTYESWEETSGEYSESDKLTGLYQNFNSALTDLDSVLNKLAK